MVQAVSSQLISVLGALTAPAFLIGASGRVEAVNGSAQGWLDEFDVALVGHTPETVFPDWCRQRDDVLERWTFTHDHIGDLSLTRMDGTAIPCQLLRLHQSGTTFLLLVFVSEADVAASLPEPPMDAVGVIALDADYRCTAANPTWTRLTGGSLRHSLGVGWLDVFAPADQPQLLSWLADLAAQPRPAARQFELMTVRRRSLRLEGQPLMDAKGSAGIMLRAHDVTSFEKAAESLRAQAYHDPLTHLPNINLLRDRLAQAQRRSRRSGDYAVMLIDIDGFRRCNEQFGRPQGDALLALVVRRVQACVRSHDTVSRLGEDEFVVLAEELKSRADAELVAQKIQRSLREPFQVADAPVSLSVSIGISYVRKRSVEGNVLLRQADAALYVAKRRGGAHIEFYSDALNESGQGQADLRRLLHDALNDGKFEIHYQPQINVENQGIFGYEALLRLRDEGQGWIGPAKFIPMLEDMGLIHRVGKWVFERACAQFQAWRKKRLVGAECRLSINLSPLQLWEPGLRDTISEVLKKTELPAPCLTLEVTEAVVLQNEDITRSIMQSLKELGLNIALDDFGTGYSSLSYLKQFPFDQVKIDRSFVRDLLSDAGSASVIDAIIGMARSFSLEVVAEGVDSSEKARLLTQQGCVIHQGYYFGYPIAVSDKIDVQQWREIFRVNPLL